MATGANPPSPIHSYPSNHSFLNTLHLSVSSDRNINIQYVDGTACERQVVRRVCVV